MDCEPVLGSPGSSCARLAPAAHEELGNERAGFTPRHSALRTILAPLSRDTGAGRLNTRYSSDDLCGIVGMRIRRSVHDKITHQRVYWWVGRPAAHASGRHISVQGNQPITRQGYLWGWLSCLCEEGSRSISMPKAKIPSSRSHNFNLRTAPPPLLAKSLCKRCKASQRGGRRCMHWWGMVPMHVE